MSISGESPRGPSDPRSGQKLYVWIIASCTLLLVCLLLWPLSVRNFRTTASFDLRYEPTSGLEKASLNKIVVDALREQTDHNGLASLVAQLESPLLSRVLKSLDPDIIRDAIHIQGRPSTSGGNTVEYRLSMLGNGSVDEIEFANLLVSQINSQLRLTLSHDNHQQVIQQLTAEFETYHNGVLHHLSGHLSRVIESVGTAQNDIQIIRNDLANIDMSGQTISAPVAMGRPSVATLDRLRNEKTRLLSEPGVTEFHPQVQLIQKQIEQLAQSASGNTGQRQEFTSTGDAPSVVIKNQFAPGATPENNTSQSIDFAAPVNQVLSDISMIDLSTPRSELQMLQQAVDAESGTAVIADRLNERAIENLQVPLPVAMTNLSAARRPTPVGGAPTTSQFMWLLLVAAGFGTVIAVNYDPALKTRRFRSVEHMQRKLGLPVVGVLRNRPTLEIPKPVNRLLATRIVRVCEWTLFGLAVLLILAALVNSEVATAFIENPFHGITRTFWLMTAR
ncbi:MAG: hypothetical protein ACR2NP_04700 [Pirellulaceae bacterium]